MKSYFIVSPPLIILGIVSLVIHCLGVDKNSKTLLIPLEMRKSQAVIDNYPVDKPPALINPDGTPLHQPINNNLSNTSDSIDVINIYSIEDDCNIKVKLRSV